MKLKQVAIGLILTSIVIGAFAALLQQQKNFSFHVTRTSPCRVEVYSGISSLQAISPVPYCSLVLPSPFTVEVQAVGESPFTNSTRSEIYDFVQANPGIQFRGICAGLSLPVGLAQYHLGVLVKAGLVSFIRDGRYKRFFESKKFSGKAMVTISLMRHNTAKRILQALLDKKRMAHGELACQVSITSQALTWHMKTLRKTEFVLEVNEGLRTIYSLDEASVPSLKKYMTRRLFFGLGPT